MNFKEDLANFLNIGYIREWPLTRDELRCYCIYVIEFSKEISHFRKSFSRKSRRIPTQIDLRAHLIRLRKRSSRKVLARNPLQVHITTKKRRRRRKNQHWRNSNKNTKSLLFAKTRQLFFGVICGLSRRRLFWFKHIGEL